MLCSIVFADQGVVIKEHNDKYAIEYNLGYLLVEWYGGYSPSEGDIYVGKFSGYGFKELYCTNADATTRFYVEDYMASKDDAWEFYMINLKPNNSIQRTVKQNFRVAEFGC